MKVFVLTHCAAEENYTPEVFTTKLAAEKRLREEFNDLMAQGNCLDYTLYVDAAEITYTDDTYDRFDIFEVEVNNE